MGAGWEPAVDPNENLDSGALQTSSLKEVRASAARVIGIGDSRGDLFLIYHSLDQRF